MIPATLKEIINEEDKEMLVYCEELKGLMANLVEGHI